MACTEIAAGHQTPTTRPTSFIETLRASLAAEPTVATAWLVESQTMLVGSGSALAATLRVDALILVVDPFDAVQQPADDGTVKERQSQELADLIERNALPVVITFYSTEPLPTALSDALKHHPPSNIYVR